MKDFFKCVNCGWQFKIYLAIKRGELLFCSHKCEIIHRAKTESQKPEVK